MLSAQKVLSAATLAVWLAATGASAQPSPPRSADGLLERPALQQLVDMQQRRDAAALVAVLADADPSVRARAAFALASVQDSTAVVPLLSLLDDPVAEVRADAAFALGQSAGIVPSETLLAALRNERDDAAARQLIQALAKKGDQVGLKELVGLDLPDAWRSDVALAVGRFALRGLHTPEAVSYLVHRLASPRADVRLAAAYYFGRTDNVEAWRPEADTLRARLDGLDTTDTAAMHLVLALGRLNDAADTPRLEHWLEHADDWRTRVNAIHALSGRTDEKGVRTLLYEQLVHPSLHVATAAAEALNDGKAWPEEDLKVIRQWVQYNAYAWRITSPLLEGMAAQDPDFVFGELARRRGSPKTEGYAAGLAALGRIDDQNAFDWLVSAAHHQDSTVAYAAYRTLARRWQRDRTDEKWAPVYFDVFSDGLRRADVALTSVIAPVLANTEFRPFGSTAVLRTVYGALHAPLDRDQMVVVLKALGDTGDPSVADLLRREATHADADINTAAVEALYALTGDEYVPPSPRRPPQRTVSWAMLKELGPHPRIELETERGSLVLELDAEEAPLTTLAFAQFVQMGFYDGSRFHRVVGNFVVQGGDYERGDGFGGPGFRLRSEFTHIPFEHGTIGMASSGKDTEGSQFFITHSMQPHLDGHYTAFGRVVSGLDVLDAIQVSDHIIHAAIIPHTSL